MRRFRNLNMNTFHYNITWPIGKVKDFEKGVDIHCIKFRWVYSSRISCMCVLDRSCLLQGTSWKICILTLTNVSVIIIQTLIAFNTQGAQGGFLSRFTSVPGSVLYLFFFLIFFRTDDDETYCRAATEYARACSHAGFPIQDWRDDFPACSTFVVFKSCIFKFQSYPRIQLA